MFQYESTDISQFNGEQICALLESKALLGWTNLGTFATASGVFIVWRYS